MLGRVNISAIVQRQSQYAGQMRTIQRAIVVKTMIAPMSVARAVVDIGLHHASRKTDPTISAAMTATIPSARRLQAGVTWLRAVVPQPRNRGRPSGRLLACPAGPRVRTSHYSAGLTTMFKAVEVTMPPRMTTAIGC